MFLRNYKDVIGGGALAIFGFAFTWYAMQHYDLGTLSSMGPGMFPVGLGVLLCVLGLATAAFALFQQTPFPEIRVRVPFFVLASVAAFTLTLTPFGLIPAVLVVTVVSSFAESKVRFGSLAGLGGALCVIAWLIFGVGLNLPIAMLRWPF
jgi:hypothetical protein